MRAILILAWRNIWRQKRRTFLTVFTVSLGLGLLLVSIGLGDGGHYQMIESAVRMGSGHVVIQKPGYQELGAVDLFLTRAQQQDAHSWLDGVGGRFGIEHVLVRTFGSGLAASAEDAAGVQLIGIDPGGEGRVSSLFDKLVEGELPVARDADRVVLGYGIVRKLSLKVGEKLVLTAQGAQGSDLQSVLVRLGGTLRTGIEEFDQGVIYVPLETAQKFFRIGPGVHQIAVIIEDSRASMKMARLGKQQLPGLEVLSWAEALPELRDFILVDDAGNYLFNSLIFVLIAFLVLNTLLMSVLERNREFALLDAMGLSPAARFTMVMVEATGVAALSSLGGFVLGFSGHLYLAVYGLPMDLFASETFTAAGVAFDPVIYSVLSAGRIIGCVLLVFGLTLSLAVAPARRAARFTDPHLLGQV